MDDYGRFWPLNIDSNGLILEIITDSYIIELLHINIPFVVGPFVVGPSVVGPFVVGPFVVICASYDYIILLLMDRCLQISNIGWK